MIQQLCGMTQPWLHMSEYFQLEHRGYCDYLYRVSAASAWSEWIGYCLKGVAYVAQKTVDRCERLRRLREEFYARLPETRGNVRLHQIVDDLFQTPLVAVADLPEALGVTYPTAKADAEKLAAVGILVELPDHHPRTYYSPEIFAIAYEGLEQ